MVGERITKVGEESMMNFDFFYYKKLPSLLISVANDVRTKRLTFKVQSRLCMFVLTWPLSIQWFLVYYLLV
jgi:hypothetical protein